ncbi:MAG: VWA domain-containing protein [Clostridiales bacterium]|nr:VWA domain-containing protein [Clostridiales bacterium]
MTLLAPLGLIGLIGIIILIIIYIIKPNYQQKLISSTYIWKLSLKYRKKKVPTSKLRNLLIILCQILILTSAAMILAKPAQVLGHKVERREVVAIIDSSASMQSLGDGLTRFERAVDKAQTLADEVLAENGIFSVILADNTPAFLVEKCSTENQSELTEELDNLIDNNVCSYGVSNIEAAFGLCEAILDDNPDTEIFLYTDTHYSYVPNSGKLNVVDVTFEDEWNVAVLDAYTVLEDNFYSLYVDVACYGRERDVTVNVLVSGANFEGEDSTGTEIELSYTVHCSRDGTTKLIFLKEDLYQEVEGANQTTMYYPLSPEEKFFSYKNIYVYIQESDSFTADNSFSIFGGQKEIIKVLYRSAEPNPFFPGVLQNLKTIYKDKWDFWVTEVRPSDKVPPEGYSGYDFYFFEHQMPEKLPKDGIVFLSNPDVAPNGADFRVGAEKNWGGKTKYMTAESETHPILNYLDASRLGITMTKALQFGLDYETLLTCDGVPTLAVCNEDDKKIVVTSFSVHYSTLAISEHISILMYNVFEYFIPATVSSNSFEVQENIALNARSDALYVTRDGYVEDSWEFTQFPATLSVENPGVYVLQQTTFGDKIISEKIYVRIPKEESNIWVTEDALENPYKTIDETNYYNDLLVYLAGALVAILFIEWWLQSRASV